jgi:hypothetical protein
MSVSLLKHIPCQHCRVKKKCGIVQKYRIAGSWLDVGKVRELGFFFGMMRVVKIPHAIREVSFISP